MKNIRATFALILMTGISACASLFSGGQNLNITFSNQTKLDICEIYISTENANDWGENKLSDTETLPSGAEKTFSVKRGKYDLLVRSCDKAAIYSNHGVSSDFIAVIGGAGEQPIRAVNGSKVEVCFIYIVPAGTGAWGEDQLGGVESILPGASRLFFVQPGSYNLRADDCNKNVLSEVDNFDPSSGQDWTIRP